MIKKERTSAQPFLPRQLSLETLKKAAEHCQGCQLYKYAIQTVFGEGPSHARVVMVGEQPGDQEDKQGKPFVGPAGKLLNRALELAGIDRREVYLTNAVKHFRFEDRGGRRLHKKPRPIDVDACIPWLEAELQVTKPEVIVCLGATAAQALMGKQFRVSHERGRFFTHPRAPWIVATVHPSSILRARDDEDRHAQMGAFVEDLKLVAYALKHGHPPNKAFGAA
ncbi:MAG TPA: UdgX family uracil-DNA binding protein [Oculatellaceae cyanobacterium]